LVILSTINSQHINTITTENREPDWLIRMREKALSNYESLPVEVSPLYSKYSDANRLKPEYIHLPDRTIRSEPYKDLVDRLDELEHGTGILQIGSSINRIFIPDKIAKQGVIISDLKEAIIQHEDLIKATLSANQLDYTEDKFLALEAAAFQSGIFIYIPKNVIIEEPIRIVNSLADNGISSIGRNIVVADISSKATVVQEIYAPPNATNNNIQQAYFELVECHVHPNSRLEMVTLQAMSGDTINFSNRKAFIDRDAKMSWYLGMFGTQLSRYKIDSIMKGPGSSGEDVEIIFGIEMLKCPGI
jgi:Fe-S cluster assembly scaffold protein SufB